MKFFSFLLTYFLSFISLYNSLQTNFKYAKLNENNVIKNYNFSQKELKKNSSKESVRMKTIATNKENNVYISNEKKDLLEESNLNDYVTAKINYANRDMKEYRNDKTYIYENVIYNKPTLTKVSVSKKDQSGMKFTLDNIRERDYLNSIEGMRKLHKSNENEFIFSNFTDFNVSYSSDVIPMIQTYDYNKSNNSISQIQMKSNNTKFISNIKAQNNSQINHKKIDIPYKLNKINNQIQKTVIQSHQIPKPNIQKKAQPNQIKLHDISNLIKSDEIEPPLDLENITPKFENKLETKKSSSLENKSIEELLDDLSDLSFIEKLEQRKNDLKVNIEYFSLSEIKSLKQFFKLEYTKKLKSQDTLLDETEKEMKLLIELSDVLELI